MGFSLLDRIVELEPGVRIVGLKTPGDSDDYLRDHFPLFPVLPGVMMLEAMYQAAAWLIRHDDDFADSMVLLQEVKTVKYADLVQPGQQLKIIAELNKREENRAWFKTRGMVEDQTVVSGRLILGHFNLASTDPTHEMTDKHIVRYLRQDFKKLYPSWSPDPQIVH